MRWVVVILYIAGTGVGARGDDRAARFRDRVQPLLVGHCVSCHGPDKQKGGLRLDSAAAGRTGGDSGPAWVAGDPDRSLLVQAVRGTRPGHPGEKMPPKDPLSRQDVAELVAWIKDGAVWAEALSTRLPAAGRMGDAWSDAANPVRKVFRGGRLDLWSLKKPIRPALPAAKNAAWVRNPIDRFITAGLEAKGLAPGPEADRRTLIRRLTFDLTGLPPTPGEVEAFARDGSPGAYEALVDRLLASPRYGERWARHWLDVARYADTQGFERDEFKPDMWRYRDYVIRSFNADKPYDRFVREQLAGDEMAAGPVRSPEDVDRWVATGFLRLGTHDTTAAIFEEDRRGRDQLMADLANTTASAILGMTYSCCQCHHHKYDPMTQEDHYRLRAFFAAVKPADDFVIDLPAELARVEARNAEIDRQLGERKAEQARLLGRGKEIVRASRTARLSDEDRRLLHADRKGLDDAGKKRLDGLHKRLNVPDGEALRAIPAADRKRYEALRAEVAGLQKHRKPFTRAWVMTDAGKSAPVTHVLYQGDYQQPKAEVPPGPPSVFDPNPATVPAVPTDTTGRRTALADWLVSADNPLTARVMVNRLWAHHFGRGLVATPNDFGYAGARPTHPGLLDWLAVEFRKRRWSLKAMHRLIVTSAAYRQSSAGRPAGRRTDPENRLLGRQNPRRLDAEGLRDALLAVSGKLRPEAGGPPRWPPVPEAVLLSNPAIYEARKGEAGGRLQDYYADPIGRTDVRSVYLIQKRSVPYPFLQPFDLPDPSVSCGCRSTTVVAPQALALLNSPDAARLSKAFADRVAREAGADPGGQVNRVFRLALGRNPEADEAKAARKLLAARSLAELCRAVFNLNEFAYLD